MRKTIFALMILLVGVSCSSDDDNNDTPAPTEAELLVSGSPWAFSSAEVQSVTYNPTGYTIQAIEGFFTDLYTGATIAFAENGTGSFTPSDGEGFSFNYEIDGENIVLTGTAFGTLEEFTVTSNTFTWLFAEVCTADDTGEDDVCGQVEFTFN